MMMRTADAELQDMVRAAGKESVGDVNSSDRGSGARFNDGKVRLDYVPAAVLACFYSSRSETEPAFEDDGDAAGYVLRAISLFEERDEGERERLVESLAASLRCAGSGIDRWRDVCAVFDKGAKKYAPWNWAKGMAWSIPLACIKRHAVKILEGEKLDDESGESHFAHIGANLVMLMHYLDNYPEGDDRPPAECFALGIEPGAVIPQEFPGQVILSPETGDVAEVDGGRWYCKPRYCKPRY